MISNAKWLVLIAFGWAYITMPNIEGKFFPVVSHAEIAHAYETENGHTVFFGKMKKLRKCEFLSIQWFMQTEDGKVKADLKFLDRATVRKPGDFTFGPWLVQMAPDDLRDRSFAVVYHACHPGWTTATKFYP